MKILEKFLKFYVNSSIHVALAVTALCLLSFLEYSVNVNLELLIFVFLGTITGYNFVKYAGIAKLHHLSLAKNLKIIQVFSFICFILLIYFSLLQKVEVLVTAFILGLLTLLYALPFLRGGINLRNLSGIKIFIIATAWAGVSVILPLINVSGLNIADVILSFMQRFIFVVALTLIFEIRDLKYDLPELKTLPQRFGLRKTKLFGVVLLLIMIILELLKNQVHWVNLLALIVAVFLTALFLQKARVDQKDFYASFWAEAVPLFWVIVWIGFNAFL